MALRTPSFSEPALRAIQESVGGLLDHPAYSERLLETGPEAVLSVAAPHDVYTLTATELMEGASLDAAKPIGRRGILMDGDRVVASVELEDPEGDHGVTTTKGPFTDSTTRAIESVETWREVTEGDYELRLLRIPSLYLMALWLKDEIGASDVLIPLDPAPFDLSVGSRYTEPELLDILRSRAALTAPGEEVGA